MLEFLFMLALMASPGLLILLFDSNNTLPHMNRHERR